MTFDESVSYLLSLGNEVLSMKLGLENITKLLDALGSPQRNYLKIQIAGTNGKGSTVAFLESICVAAKIKVGATTSPHLISITERVRINGVEISETDFARLATKVRETSEKLVENFNAQNSEQSKIQNPKSKIGLETVPTYFEQVTAIALTAFAENAVELAILETGLGGRFDATTAANAEIAAITPIDLDHQEFLGNTLAEIAAEKAAIIREQTKKVIAAPQSSREIVHEIWLKCEENNLEPIWATANVEQNGITAMQMLNGVNLTTFSDNYRNVVLSLKGKHQFANAILAVRIAEVLRDFQFKIERENIITGLQTAEHPGRLELYKGILFDGAHNISGAKALREYLDEFVQQPITMIFGAMRDKDLSEIAALLFPKAENIILTIPDNPRSLPTAEMIEYAPENVDRTKVFPTENVESAVTLALEIIKPDELILITGSLYLVGEAQKFLRENFRENL